MAWIYNIFLMSLRWRQCSWVHWLYFEEPLIRDDEAWEIETSRYFEPCTAQMSWKQFYFDKSVQGNNLKIVFGFSKQDSSE